MRGEKGIRKCINCNKDIIMLLSIIKAREKKSLIKYCNKKCESSFIKMSKRECVFCKLMYQPKRDTSKFCSSFCLSSSRRGVKIGNGYWYENGYKVLYTSNGNGIKEHRKIMEDYIGRKLQENEIVHHINHVRDDNRIENLQLMDKCVHSSIHRKEEIENGTFNYFKNKIVEDVYPITIEVVKKEDF